MNKNQSTVLGLLLAAAGLHIWLDPKARSSFKQFLTITPQNWKQIGKATIQGYLLWFIALAAMLLLADYLPHLALWIAALILVGAVLINNGAVADFLSSATQAIAPGGDSIGPKPVPDKTK